MNENISEKQKWHGVIREEIVWFPKVDTEMYIGCGIGVLGCGPKVYKFNYDEKKAVVVAPYKCKVGCVTYANTCPANAISSPSLSYLHKIIKINKVISVSKKELDLNKAEYSFSEEL